MSAAGNQQDLFARNPSSSPTKKRGVSVDGQQHRPPLGASTASAATGKEGALALIRGLSAAKRMEAPLSDATKDGRFQLSWNWVRANSSREAAVAVMRFVGWLDKTGTHDPDTLLALTKHFAVHRPDNPHAYYTPRGLARQSIAMRVAGDRAIEEHERIKQQEREFLREGTDGTRREADT